MSLSDEMMRLSIADVCVMLTEMGIRKLPTHSLEMSFHIWALEIFAEPEAPISSLVSVTNSHTFIR